MVYRIPKRLVACAFLTAGLLLQISRLPDGFAGEPAVGAPAADANFPGLKLIKSEAESGEAKSQAKLGDYYFAKSDYTNAVIWYRKAAEHGEADAQRCLAACFINGRGVVKDVEEAGRWQRRAAAQTSGSGQTAKPVANATAVTNSEAPKIVQARTPVASAAQATRIQALQAVAPTFQGPTLAVRPYPNP